jgi:hypothetical protein
MTLRGHVRDGKITLDSPALIPPEGTAVIIELVEDTQQPAVTQPAGRRRQPFQPVQLPGGPLSDAIINDRR